MRSVVGPGTGSAMSYQWGSCDGQKYGPLNTSCRPRICPPRRPASSINGRCTSIDACRILTIDTAGSVIGDAAWIRPPRPLRGIDTSLSHGPRGGAEAPPRDDTTPHLEPPGDRHLLVRIELEGI